VPQLISGRQIVRPYLGVSTTQAPGGGALVVSTVTAGPAAKAGLRAGASGDVIKAIDGKTVTDPNDVSAAIDQHKPGDKVKVEVQRGGSRQTVEVTLGTRPNQVPQGP
jgi:S1-C subfamily serine protease